MKRRGGWRRRQNELARISQFVETNNVQTRRAPRKHGNPFSISDQLDEVDWIGTRSFLNNRTQQARQGLK